MEEEKRSLYQCFNAKVKDLRIVCFCGIDMPVKHLQQGKPLELAICQACLNYDCMGGPVAKEDRGWQEDQLGPSPSYVILAHGL